MMEKKEKQNQSLPKEKRRVVVEAKPGDIKKLESFLRVMQDVAEDMGLEAYPDRTEYLYGIDY
jgi:hypothetical protein